jgi:biopolymer transport protein ExbD
MMASLMLTPMVDMFSLLVIFLLQFFTAAPEIDLTRNLILPHSHSGDQVSEVPVISVTSSSVSVNKETVGSLNDLLKTPGPLMTALQAARADWITQNPSQTSSVAINLEAHEDLPSTKISQIMGLLSASEFGTIELLTLAN